MESEKLCCVAEVVREKLERLDSDAFGINALPFVIPILTPLLDKTEPLGMLPIVRLSVSSASRLLSAVTNLSNPIGLPAITESPLVSNDASPSVTGTTTTELAAEEPVATCVLSAFSTALAEATTLKVPSK